MAEPVDRDTFLKNLATSLGYSSKEGIGLLPAMEQIEHQYGLPPGYLAQTAKHETGGTFNPQARPLDKRGRPLSSALGLFQFLAGTGQDYGIVGEDREFDWRGDPLVSADAAGRFAQKNAGKFKEYMGRDPTSTELYIMHQQGPGGLTLLAAPDTDSVGRYLTATQIRNGSGRPGDTVGEFKARLEKSLFSDPFYSPQDAPFVEGAGYQRIPGSAYAEQFSGATGAGVGFDTNINPFTGAAWGSSPYGAAGGTNGLGSIFNSINKIIPPSPYAPSRAGGGDIAGYDLSGIAFDRAGNPLGTTGISRGLQEGLREMQDRYAGYQDMDPSRLAGLQGQFAGRYAYSGDLRPQDAAFLFENPGATITREGRYVLPAEYAPAALGLDPDASDYAGRYDTSGAPSLEDALFLQQNPSFTLAKGGANTGYGYIQDPTTGSYVPNNPIRDTGNYDPLTGSVKGAQPGLSARELNGFDTPTTPYVPIPVPDVSRNPAADASVIPGITTPTITEAVVPSFTDPGINFPGYPYGPGSPAGGTTGSSGISPSTVGPSGVASPYPADPNRTTEPRGISIIMPNTLGW